MNSSNSGRGLWRVIGVSNQPNNTATSRSFSKSSRDKSKDRFTITKKSENESPIQQPNNIKNNIFQQLIGVPAQPKIIKNAQVTEYSFQQLEKKAVIPEQKEQEIKVERPIKNTSRLQIKQFQQIIKQMKIDITKLKQQNQHEIIGMKLLIKQKDAQFKQNLKKIKEQHEQSSQQSKTKISSQLKQITQLQQQKLKLQRKLADMEEQYSYEKVKKDKKFQNLQQRYEQLETKLQTRQKQLKQMKQLIGNTQEQQKTQLKKQRNRNIELQQQIQNYKIKFKQEIIKNNQLMQQNQHLSKEIKNINYNCQEITLIQQKSKNNRYKEDALQQNSKLQDMLRQQRQVNSRSIEKINDLQYRIKHLSSTIGELQKSLNSEISSRQQLQFTNQKLKKENRQLYQQIFEFQQKAIQSQDNKGAQFEKFNYISEQQQTEIDTLNRKLQQNMGYIRTLQNQIELRDEKLQQLQRENAERRNFLHQKEQQLIKKQTTINAKIRQYQYLKNKELQLHKKQQYLDDYTNKIQRMSFKERDIYEQDKQLQIKAYQQLKIQEQNQAKRAELALKERQLKILENQLKNKVTEITKKQAYLYQAEKNAHEKIVKQKNNNYGTKIEEQQIIFNSQKMLRNIMKKGQHETPLKQPISKFKHQFNNSAKIPPARSSQKLYNISFNSQQIQKNQASSKISDNHKLFPQTLAFSPRSSQTNKKNYLNEKLQKLKDEIKKQIKLIN